MRAYERLLKYVKVHTTSDPNSGTHPSTLRQFDLAKILVEELKELGLTDAMWSRALAMSTPRCPPPRGRRAPRRWALSPHGHGGRRQR